MLERFAISVATTTILAVLAKVALLFHDARNLKTGADWLSEPVQQSVLRILLIATFLVFFRGKMMHDDATFFADLAKPGTFRSTRTARALLKILLPLSYVSWILSGPAIYFLGQTTTFVGLHDRVPVSVDHLFGVGPRCADDQGVASLAFGSSPTRCTSLGFF